MTIRLSLARMLLNLGRRPDAAAELTACECELPNGDNWDQAEWEALVAEASSKRPTQ